MDNTRYCIANWKMNITASAAMKFMDAWQNKNLSNKSVKTIICPPFTALYPISSFIEKISFELGAQNVYHEDVGAFTGEISCEMLKELGCQWVIIGHSERRMHFAESDLIIKKNSYVAFVGPSGSGKTTVVDVILGLLVNQSGALFYNGAPLHESLESWRRNVAYLPQEVFMIDDSLRHNISLGSVNGDLDSENQKKAIMQAQLSDLISELPDGVDTQLGEQGIRLSGGQRQRVALARAFYHQREVLVLDEATSALDTDTEREIVQEMQRLKGKVTMIVIAHRLSTLQHCDRIYKLNRGEIVEVGSYRDMISN